MSSYEYYDMFRERQDKGKYHMFVFDIVNSQKMDVQARTNATYQMEKLMLNMYNTIKRVEEKEKKKILITGIDNIVHYDERHKNNKKFGLLYEPFLFADSFGITIYRNSLSKEEVLCIYKKHKEELNINFDFHIADGFYETNKWEEGSKLLFRGYCIDILSTCHKDYTKELIKKNKTKSKVKHKKNV